MSWLRYQLVVSVAACSVASVAMAQSEPVGLGEVTLGEDGADDIGETSEEGDECEWRDQGCKALVISLIEAGMGEEDELGNMVAQLAESCTVYAWINDPAGRALALSTPSGRVNRNYFTLNAVNSPQTAATVDQLNGGFVVYPDDLDSAEVDALRAQTATSFTNTVGGNIHNGSWAGLGNAFVLNAISEAFYEDVAGNGADVAVTIIDAHGNAPSAGSCGTWSEFDGSITGHTLDRGRLLFNVYRAARDATCAQFVYDHSCYGGATVHAGEILNNVGTTPFLNKMNSYNNSLECTTTNMINTINTVPGGNDDCEHAAYERDLWASPSSANQTILPNLTRGSNFTVIGDAYEAAQGDNVAFVQSVSNDLFAYFGGVMYPYDDTGFQTCPFR